MHTSPSCNLHRWAQTYHANGGKCTLIRQVKCVRGRPLIIWGVVKIFTASPVSYFFFSEPLFPGHLLNQFFFSLRFSPRPPPPEMIIGRSSISSVQCIIMNNSLYSRVHQLLFRSNMYQSSWKLKDRDCVMFGMYTKSWASENSSALEN